VGPDPDCPLLEPEVAVLLGELDVPDATPVIIDDAAVAVREAIVDVNDSVADRDVEVAIVRRATLLVQRDPPLIYTTLSVITGADVIGLSKVLGRDTGRSLDRVP